MNTEIYLLRHGETENSQADLYYGRTSSPVTVRGRSQTELLARRLQHLPLAAVYTSPLERCKEAALLIGHAHNLIPVAVSNLIEIDYGKWEGLSREQVAAKYPDTYKAWQADPAGVNPEDGESGYIVACRVVPTIITLARSHLGEMIVVMSHNTINRVLLCHFLGLPISEFRNKIFQHPAALNHITFSSTGSWRVHSMNDVSHLKSEV